MMKFKLLWENGFENSLNIFTVTDLRSLFSARDIVLNERETICKNDVCKQSPYSHLYSVFCFTSIPCLGIKIQTWRHYFSNTLVF